MTILENPLLSGCFLVINISALLILYYSFIKKKYYYAFIGFLIQTLLSVIYFFLTYLKGDIFVFANPQDFTANLVYFSALMAGFINSLFGMKMYYQHRVISAIIIQLALFFPVVQITTHLSDSIYYYFIQQKDEKMKAGRPGAKNAEDIEFRTIPEDSLGSK